MTDATNYNNGGARQEPKYLTVEIGYDEFGATSASAPVLNMGVLPPDAITLPVIVNVGTAFNGGGTDLLEVGHEDDADAFYTSTTLASTGVLAVANGADIGKKQTTRRTVKAKYTCGGSVPSAGSVRITLPYIAGNAADAVYD